MNQKNSKITWLPDCGYPDIDTLHWLEDPAFRALINGGSDDSATDATDATDATESESCVTA